MTEQRLDRPIRLCVTDLDGCLLDAESRVPDCFEEALALCEQKGITVSAASGRSVEGMTGALGLLAQRMALISDNGARVFVRGREMTRRTFPADLWRPVALEARRHPRLHLVMTLPEGAVLDSFEPLDPAGAEILKKYYPEWKTADLLLSERDAVKLSLLYFGDIEKEIYPFFSSFNGEELCLKCTARTWIDVNLAGLDKGSGVRELQRILGTGSDETAVFGDYLNDLPMAAFAGWSFAPSNAHPEVLERFGHRIGHHNAGSVARAIRSLAEGFLPAEGTESRREQDAGNER